MSSIEEETSLGLCLNVHVACVYIANSDLFKHVFFVSKVSGDEEMRRAFVF